MFANSSAKLIPKNDFVSSIYTDKMAVFLPYERDGHEDGYRMPLFLYQDYTPSFPVCHEEISQLRQGDRGAIMGKNVS